MSRLSVLPLLPLLLPACVSAEAERDKQAKDFWSFVNYDPQTRSLLQTPSTPFPSVSSQNGTVQSNPDGSTTLWFGPEPPAGKETNWVPTVRGKGWFMVLRLYGPLESWFDQTWRLGEIRLIK